MRAATLALAALAVLLLTGCPRGGVRQPAREDEPKAEPAEVEIDWPDAGVRR